VADAPEWLAPGGHLVIETSTDQAATTAALATAAGLTAQILRDDDLDATAVLAGRRVD
jgi:release factor glutamine methyltransferase